MALLQTAQTAAEGPDPERPDLVLMQAPDGVAGQSVSPCKPFYFTLVKAQQPFFGGARPDRAVITLDQAADIRSRICWSKPRYLAFAVEEHPVACPAPEALLNGAQGHHRRANALRAGGALKAVPRLEEKPSAPSAGLQASLAVFRQRPDKGIAQTVAG